jgi:hypothetical protein
MCAALVKLSLLFVTVSWCPSADRVVAASATNAPTVVQIFITAHAVEITLGNHATHARAGAACLKQL